MTIFVKHKDKIVMGLGVVFFILYFLGVQYLSAGMTTMDENALAAMLTGGLMDTITRAFPPALWAAKSLVYTGSSGMNAFLLFTGVSVGALILSTFVAGCSFILHQYQPGEAAKSEKRVNLDKSSKPQSAFRALLARGVENGATVPGLCHELFDHGVGRAHYGVLYLFHPPG